VGPTVISWDDVAPADAGGAVRKRLIAGADAQLVRVEIAAGTRAGRHDHPHEQFVQVLSGSGVLEMEAGRREFGPGTVFHFPPGAWHAAEFRTDTVLVETNLAELGR
jgi:quercetin dioxygenase-like cupin family protein